MAVRTVRLDERDYRFSPDDQPPRAARHWMLVRARLVNDVTLRPVTEDVRIDSDLPAARPRIADDGVVGLVAVPRKVFPILAGRNYTLTLTLRARGYLDQTISIVIPTDQKMTVNPFPAVGDRILTLDNTVNVQVGEMLMIGNPLTAPGTVFEETRIEALGPGLNQVSIRPALKLDHSGGPEPVVPVIPADFGPADAGDVLMVPQP